MHRHIKYDDITAKAKVSKASKCAGVLGYAYDFASLPALVAPLVAPAFPLRLQFLDDPATQKWESNCNATMLKQKLHKDFRCGRLVPLDSR